MRLPERPADPVKLPDSEIAFSDPPMVDTKNTRRRNDDADRRLADRIKAVIATSRQRWPKTKSQPSIRTMAQKLLDDKKSEGFGFSTLRAILGGTYPAMKALGINPPW